MTTPWSVRRWVSSSDLLQAAELVSDPVPARLLPSALAFVRAAASPDTAFIVVRLDCSREDAVSHAFAAADASGAGPRICFAVERAVLASIDAADAGSDRVGWMLDDVDADTPLSDIANQHLVAVRFREGFVTESETSLRGGCILDAMLGLTRNLGLCSLGRQAMRAQGRSAALGGFDYLPVAPSIGASATQGRATLSPRALKATTP